MKILETMKINEHHKTNHKNHKNTKNQKNKFIRNHKQYKKTHLDLAPGRLWVSTGRARGKVEFCGIRGNSAGFCGILRGSAGHNFTHK